MTRPHIHQDHTDPFLTTRQAAQLLGVSLRSVQLWVEAGTLPAGSTPGGHRRIRRSAVEALAGQNDISLAPTPAQAAAARDVKELRAQLDRALADGKRLHEAYLGAERELEAARADVERLRAQRQQLTDEQIRALWVSGADGPFAFARAIERAHGIGAEGGAV